MDQKRWFLLLDGQVTGPFMEQEIENRVDANKDALIWGRGQSEWLGPERWRLTVKALKVQQSLELQNTRLWKMRVNDKELSPMNLDDLIDHLKDFADLTPVRLWTEGFDDWKEVFQVRIVMDELGISRRTHARVPIMGTLQGTASIGELQAKVISISEGGLGVNSAKGLQIGETFSANLASPNLFMNIKCNMEVVYVSPDGYAGMRFLSLPSEARAAIIEYVKKFQQVPK